MTRAGWGGDRGAAAVEFTLLVPLLVLLFGIVVGGARVWLARTTVDAAAAAGARAASLARAPATAVADAERLARAQLAVDGLHCVRLSVDVSARGLAAAPGAPAQVSASVRCVVPLADVLVPGWPGELTVAATASSAVDSYRGRA